MANTDRAADPAISANPGRILKPVSGRFADAVITAPYVAKVPRGDIATPWRGLLSGADTAYQPTSSFRGNREVQERSDLATRSHRQSSADAAARALLSYEFPRLREKGETPPGTGNHSGGTRAERFDRLAGGRTPAMKSSSRMTGVDTLY